MKGFFFLFCCQLLLGEAMALASTLPCKDKARAILSCLARERCHNLTSYMDTLAATGGCPSLVDTLAHTFQDDEMCRHVVLFGVPLSQAGRGGPRYVGKVFLLWGNIFSLRRLERVPSMSNSAVCVILVVALTLNTLASMWMGETRESVLVQILLLIVWVIFRYPRSESRKLAWFLVFFYAYSLRAHGLWNAFPSDANTHTKTCGQAVREAMQGDTDLAFVSELKQELLPARPESWNDHDVQFWLRINGLQEETRQELAELQVDGKLLLKLTDEDLRESLGIMEAAEREKLSGLLQQLRSATGYHAPHEISDFWEYRQLNRFRVAWLGTALFGLPRCSLLYFYLTSSNESGLLLHLFKMTQAIPLAGPALFYIGIIVAPNLVIAACAWQYLAVNYWVTMAVLVSSVSCFKQEMQDVRQMCLPPGELEFPRSFVRFSLPALFSYTSVWVLRGLGAMFAVLWTWSTFWFVPWFITDLSLYLSLGVSLQHGLKPAVYHLQNGNWFRGVLHLLALMTPALTHYGLRSSLSFRLCRELCLALLFVSLLSWGASQALRASIHRLVIQRKDVLGSSLQQLAGQTFYSTTKFVIMYVDMTGLPEKGLDAGGLYRDWLGSISAQLFDPKLGLITETDPVDGRIFYRLNEAPAPPISTISTTPPIEISRPSRFPNMIKTKLPIISSYFARVLPKRWRRADRENGACIPTYYRFMGKVIGLSLRDKLPLGVRLAPPLSRALCFYAQGHMSAPTPNNKQKSSALELVLLFPTSDVRYLSMGLYGTCIDPAVPSAVRAANLHASGLTYHFQAPEEHKSGSEASFDEYSPEHEPFPDSESVSLTICQRDRQTDSVALSTNDNGQHAERPGYLKNRFPESQEEKPVTIENINQYASRLCKLRFEENVSTALQEIVKGIAEIYPAIRETSPSDLRERVLGEETIHVSDWQAHSKVFPVHKRNSDVVKWFWSFVESLPNSERAALLFWITGLRAPPCGGFGKLSQNTTLSLIPGSSGST
eukprot:gb/GEZN01001091.1/.p1 GENE.gb/GEZN01001091.1/~~gb/GEZN01001091.1/.p1  ORF type:complete len:1002 (-),score=81.17 gb/GEZN01001091.1/:301-3306(-)